VSCCEPRRIELCHARGQGPVGSGPGLVDFEKNQKEVLELAVISPTAMARTSCTRICIRRPMMRGVRGSLGESVGEGLAESTQTAATHDRRPRRRGQELIGRLYDLCTTSRSTWSADEKVMARLDAEIRPRVIAFQESCGGRPSC